MVIIPRERKSVMINLNELIEATAWRHPEEHLKLTLWYPNNAYKDDAEEFVDIECNVRTVVEYGTYPVMDIDVEDGKLTCLIKVSSIYGF